MIYRALLLLFFPISIFTFEWSPLAPLYEKHVEGAMVGVHNQAIIIAGGKSGEEYLDDIIIFTRDKKGKFHKFVDASHKLPCGLAHGVTISTEKGVVIAGGETNLQLTSKAYLVSWNSKSNKIDIKQLPEMPIALSHAGGSYCNQKIFILGGKEQSKALGANSRMYELNMKDINKLGWKFAGYVPIPPRLDPIVLAQSNGLRHNIYVIGGKSISEQTKFQDSYSYDPTLKMWRVLDSLPDDYKVANGTTSGSNILLLQGDDIYAYHTILGSWWLFDELPTDQSFQYFSKVGSSYILGPDTTQGRFWESKLEVAASFGVLNYIIIGVYFSFLLWIGLYFSKREKSIEDYFIASHRIPWWASGLSIFGTAISALSFLGLTSKAFVSNWHMFNTKIALLFVLPIIIGIFIPFYRKLEIITAYEYLEKRFSVSIRLLGSTLFIMFQLLRIGIVIYLPSIALSIITGFSVTQCVVAMGGLTLMYTVLGGIEAVIWTDVLQVFFLLFGAVFVPIYILSVYDGLWSEFVTLVQTGQKTQIFDLALDIKRPTFWVIFLGGAAYHIMTFGSDQSFVQRYLATKNINDSRKAVYLNVFLCTMISLILCIVGTSLYVFYQAFPEKIDPTISIIDGILVNFIAHELPPGVSGIVITGLFAASMSSLDSSMNAVSSAITVDFYQRFSRNQTKEKTLNIAKFVTFLVGIFGTLYALYLNQFPMISLLDIYDTLISLTLTSLGGIFLLGMISKRANSRGIWVGYTSTLIFIFFIHLKTPIHFFLNMFISSAGTMIFSYIASFFFESDESGKDTIYDI